MMEIIVTALGSFALGAIAGASMMSRHCQGLLDQARGLMAVVNQAQASIDDGIARNMRLIREMDARLDRMRAE